MISRNIKITFRLNEQENRKLKIRIKKSGMSQEAYIRHLINGYMPADLPPPDYRAMMNELRTIGRNMNQVAQKAHVLNVIDSRRYDEAFGTLKQSLIEIVKAVTQPRKIETRETGLPPGTMILRDGAQPQAGTEAISSGGNCEAGDGRTWR